MSFIKIIVIIVVVVNTANSQIDTAGIRLKVNSLKSIEDHSRFWDEVYAIDQKYRGKTTNDSIDKLNLIKCCVYLNRFGFPDKDIIGKKSSIITIVWIHNKFPQVDLLTFPIIMEGYRTKQIDENDFRNSYFRSIYKRQFSDEGYNDLSLADLINKVGPNTSIPININEVLQKMKEEETFLSTDHQQVGSWLAPTTFDTAYYDGKPIVHNTTNASVDIFMDAENQHYLFPKYEDRSGYPHKLIQVGDDPLRFKKYKEDESYLEITPDGNLVFAEEDSEIIVYTPEESKGSENNIGQEDEELMFGCYPSSDTLEYLIAYFPEQKEFFINNTLCTKEDLCKTIRHSIESNKGVMHYYAPESNFMFMISIVREIEKCYKNKIDELSEKIFGANYETLSPEQKTIIDSQLTYRMESK